jgi:CDGSH-type Zn-finger protein
MSLHQMASSCYSISINSIRSPLINILLPSRYFLSMRALSVSHSRPNKKIGFLIPTQFDEWANPLPRPHPETPRFLAEYPIAPKPGSVERNDVQRGYVADKKPSHVYLKPGVTYYWCSCGFSNSQPFCDGSHKRYMTRTSYFFVNRPRFRPVPFRIELQSESDSKSKQNASREPDDVEQILVSANSPSATGSSTSVQLQKAATTTCCSTRCVGPTNPRAPDALPAPNADGLVETWLCVCKHTGWEHRPFCDGSHRRADVQLGDFNPATDKSREGVKGTAPMSALWGPFGRSSGQN